MLSLIGLATCPQYVFLMFIKVLRLISVFSASSINSTVSKLDLFKINHVYVNTGVLLEVNI